MARNSVNSPGYHVPIRGFSQAVTSSSSGPLVFVSGLTSRTSEGEIVFPGDISRQTRQVLENLKTVLAAAGCTLDDVVQIHTYVTAIDGWDDIEAVWRDYWGEIWPASTLVEVSRLYDPRQMIEMEAIAVLPQTR